MFTAVTPFGVVELLERAIEVRPSVDDADKGDTEHEQSDTLVDDVTEYTVMDCQCQANANASGE